MLLSAIVSVLAVSSFWGLYGYSSFAEALGARAEELQRANSVYRWSESLRDSHSRILELVQQDGMIDASLLNGRLIKNEREAMDLAIESLDRTLGVRNETAGLSKDDFGPNDEATAARSNAVAGDRVAFLETNSHAPNIETIANLWKQIGKLRNRSNFVEPTNQQKLEEGLDALVDMTRDYTSSIQSGMAKLGGDVRGQYRVWIIAAWVSFALAVFLVAALIWLFTSLIVQPFQTLLEGSRLVAGGQLGHRIDLGTGDELCELADAMNDMTNKFQVAYEQLNAVCSDLDRQVQQRTREVIQNEQLASVGFLAAGVAHEINNPLATIAWSAESLESRIEALSADDHGDHSIDRETVSVLHTNLRRIQDEAFRCKGITERLLDFSRLGEVKRASTDLSTLVSDVVDMVSKVGKYRCKTLRANCDESTLADVNPQEIRQVVLNLLTNALESVDCDGAVDVRVVRAANHIQITVSDNGCGMTPDVLQHLFEPFFTRRVDGSGTGLGLSISYRIVCQHGGTLVPHSDGPGRGTRMELTLPIHADTALRTINAIANPTWNHESYQAA